MNHYEYKVSVIVPVYNVAAYLGECLDSLLAQTIDHDEMEVLLINDGSTDGSLEICREYAKLFPVFKVFSKENEGLSATRNYGIERAGGKYLMYLDSDDMFIPETVKAVTDFFDTVYDEVDLVTYLEQPYKNGKKIDIHFRYDYLTKTGVYDLSEYPFICQTRINICVKNLFQGNPMFDTTPDFKQEDQEYCSKILMKKQRIGFCAKGEYCYNRSNETSIVSNKFHAYYMFETSTAYFEKLAAQFETDVPEYYQNMIFNDMVWKLQENKLFPYHYCGEEFQNAVERLKKLLSKISVSVIMNHPRLDNFQKQYWLGMKPNAAPTVVARENEISICVDGNKVYGRTNMEIILHKLSVEQEQLHFRAFVKSPVYNHLPENAHVFAIENGDTENKRLLDVCLSIHSYYKTQEMTNRFYLFSYHCDTNIVHSVKFVVAVDGIFFDTVFWCMPVSVFNKETGISSYVRNRVQLTLENNELFFKQISEEETEKFELAQTAKYIQNPPIYNLRMKSLKYRKQHRVWLYYDLYTVRKDNGYYQFINDFRHADGIERYYVYDRELSEIEKLFSDEQKSCLIQFGSEKHKLLYLSAEKVLTAFYGFSTVSPFKTEKEESSYLDMIRFQTIYLQHGVLHANLRLKNHAERCRADKIVVSSYFEKENYIKNYGYEEDEIISTGMARYDHIDRNTAPENKILFAPSWRKYLTNEITSSKWELLEDKILNSDYYKNFNAFLSNERLGEMLEEKNLLLDIKLHPVIRDAQKLFEIENPRIHIAPDEVKIEDYRLFITDFSSFVFDFGYLSRPVIYFVPDMLQFQSGMNHYRELDLPWEKAFGNLVTDPESAVGEVVRIAENGFLPDIKFKERMDQFYLPMENCADSLYRYLMGEIKNEDINAGVTKSI